jgi:hypothetical protein
MTAVLAPGNLAHGCRLARGRSKHPLGARFRDRSCGPEPASLAVEYSAIGMPDFEKWGTYAQSQTTDCLLIS